MIKNIIKKCKANWKALSIVILSLLVLNQILGEASRPEPVEVVHTTLSTGFTAKVPLYQMCSDDSTGRSCRESAYSQSRMSGSFEQVHTKLAQTLRENNMRITNCSPLGSWQPRTRVYQPSESYRADELPVETCSIKYRFLTYERTVGYFTLISFSKGAAQIEITGKGNFLHKVDKRFLQRTT